MDKKLFNKYVLKHLEIHMENNRLWSTLHTLYIYITKYARDLNLTITFGEEKIGDLGNLG